MVHVVAGITSNMVPANDAHELVGVIAKPVDALGERVAPNVKTTEPLSGVPRSEPGDPTTTHTLAPAATGKVMEKHLLEGHQEESRVPGALTSPDTPTEPP